MLLHLKYYSPIKGECANYRVVLNGPLVREFNIKRLKVPFFLTICSDVVYWRGGGGNRNDNVNIKLRLV